MNEEGVNHRRKGRPWALYLRVSTRREDQEGGLASQLLACQDFLRRRGLPPEEAIVFREQASGRQTNRPILRKLLHQAAMHQFGYVLVFKLDRLSRGGIVPTFQLLQTLHDRGVRVYSVSESWWEPDNAVHEAVLAILSFAARIESESIAERVSAGISRKRAEAERRGEPFLWGRARTSPLRRDPQLPDKAVQLRKDGLSWTETAQTLGIGTTTARRMYRLGLASKANGTRSEGEKLGDGRSAN